MSHNCTIHCFETLRCSNRKGDLYTTIVGKFLVLVDDDLNSTICEVHSNDLIHLCPLFIDEIDGANVAYYGHSNVHYSSLKKVVEKLESMGERPLVVMPEKYTSKSWACRPNFYQKRTQKDEEVIEW